MDAISYTAFRSRLASNLDKVNDDQTPLLVTRQNGKPAVVMSLEEYHSLEETAYLLGSPANVLRLTESIRQIDLSNTFEHALLEEEE